MFTNSNNSNKISNFDKWLKSIQELCYYQNKTRMKAIVEYLDYQIPVTQLMGPKGNGDMQAAKRDFFLINR